MADQATPPNSLETGSFRLLDDFMMGAREAGNPWVMGLDARTTLENLHFTADGSIPPDYSDRLRRIMQGRFGVEIPDNVWKPYMPVGEVCNYVHEHGGVATFDQPLRRTREEVTIGSQKLEVATTYHNSSQRNLIVALHGFMCGEKSWDGMFSDPSLEDFSQLTMDLPGCGASTKPTRIKLSPRVQAEAVNQLLDRHEHPQIHLVAHSQGNIAALMIATGRHADRISSFTCVEGNLVAGDGPLAAQIAACESAQAYQRDLYPQHLRLDVTKPDFQFAAGDPRCIYDLACSAHQRTQSGTLLRVFNHLDVPRKYIYGSQSDKANVIRRLKSEIQPIEIENADHFVMARNPKAFYQTLSLFILGLTLNER